MTTLRTNIFAVAAMLAAAAVSPRARARASNVSPLAFGMTPQEAADALRSFACLCARPARARKSSSRSATPACRASIRSTTRIFLQFRRGRLTGWKNDWRMRNGWLF